MVKIKKIFILIILILNIFTFISCNTQDKSKSYSYYELVTSKIDDKYVEYNNIFLSKYEDFVIKMPVIFDFSGFYTYETIELFKENYILVVYRNGFSIDEVVEYTNFKFENNTIYFDVKTLPSWIVIYETNFDYFPVFDLVVIPKTDLPQDFNPDEEHGLVINRTKIDGSYVSKDCFPVMRISLDDHADKMKKLGIERTQEFITSYEELKEMFDKNPECNQEDRKCLYSFICEEYFEESIFDNNVILLVVRLDTDSKHNVEQIYYDMKVKGDKIILKEGSRYVDDFITLEMPYEFVDLDIHYDFVVIPKSKFPEDFDFEIEYKWKIKNKFVDSLRPRLGINNYKLYFNN